MDLASNYDMFGQTFLYRVQATLFPPQSWYYSYPSLLFTGGLTSGENSIDLSLTITYDQKPYNITIAGRSKVWIYQWTNDLINTELNEWISNFFNECR